MHFSHKDMDKKRQGSYYYETSVTTEIHKVIFLKWLSLELSVSYHQNVTAPPKIDLCRLNPSDEASSM